MGPGNETPPKPPKDLSSAELAARQRAIEAAEAVRTGTGSEGRKDQTQSSSGIKSKMSETAATIRGAFIGGAASIVVAIFGFGGSYFGAREDAQAAQCERAAAIVQDEQLSPALTAAQSARLVSRAYEIHMSARCSR